jgi:glucokinase
MSERSEPAIVVGVDLGGTRLRVAAAAADDPTRAAPTMLTDGPVPTSLPGLRTALADAVAAAEPVGVVTAMAMCVPGLVDGTVSSWVPNVPYLDGVDLATLDARLVAAGNDAHFALLAEAAVGAAAERSDALLLAIGTGIGSAVLAGGRLLLGSSGAAASFGWACADVTDRGDDRLGWLERHAAGPALDAAGGRLEPPRDGAGLVAAAAAGDAGARAAIDNVAATLGTALAGAVALLDPGLVIISGGVADAVDVLLPALRRALELRLPPHLRGVEVVGGHLGPRAGLVGALVAAARGRQWWTVRP